MMQKVFPDLPIYKVKEIGLEFIPTPIERYSNDKSAMHVFVRFFDKNGGEYLIAIETKYTDSLGTNTTDSKEVYEKQIKLLRDLNLLTDEYHYKITAITLEYFLANIQSVASEEQSPWLGWFCDRYLNFETSIR